MTPTAKAKCSGRFWSCNMEPLPSGFFVACAMLINFERELYYGIFFLPSLFFGLD